MPPSTGGKRKRGDRTSSDDNFSRPSPHRPANLGLAQQSPSYASYHSRNFSDNRGRGTRRSSRGGRGATVESEPITKGQEFDSIATQTQHSRTSTPAHMNGAMFDTGVPNAVRNSDGGSAKSKIPYHYTYLTAKRCETWQERGHEEVQQQAQDVVRQSGDVMLEVFLQELVQSAAGGRIPAADAGAIVRVVLAAATTDTDVDGGSESPSPAQAAVLDCISIAVEDDPACTLPLADFVEAVEMPVELLRQELDAGLLEKFGFIRNTFGRMGIRKQTNVLYRQANFNLMREEAEGFAKLMTELFATSGNEPPSGRVVEGTVERVKAMIGAFDLDVGRSLDIVLDVFGAVLVKQFRFFVKFLRASPWWPRSDIVSDKLLSARVAGLPLWAEPGVSDWHLTEDQKVRLAYDSQIRDHAFWDRARNEGLKAYYQLGRSEAPEDVRTRAKKSSDAQDISSQWITETGMMPPSGNCDAAQLLGFKLRFYSSSTARDEGDVLPDNLIYLSALLVKIGFISLDDLYSHIWRSDEEMEELRKVKLKEKLEREGAARPGAGTRNALLTAGALADDTLPIPNRLREPTTRASTPAREAGTEKSAIREKDSIPEATDQKVLLLKSLLAIGALPEALFILGRFPWVLDLYPDMPEYIHRILHHSLWHVYGKVQPLMLRDSLQSQKPLYETELTGLPKGQVKLVDATSRKVLRWALLDKMDSTEGLDYRFYWDEWNDNIPVCQTIDDVFTLCDTLLSLVGVKIGQDPALVLKLARIGKHSLAEDFSEANQSRWLDLSRRTLLPALSLTRSNAGVVSEVFELISYFPIKTRYLMYLEWSGGRTSRIPDVKVAFDQAKAETKDVLKRISKTNIRPMARALAKIAYANPHIVITTALAQIEVYDSIAEVFVEGARYFTDLGYDVLTWAMISSLARAGRSRIQEGGIFTSRWLSALSQFAGKIYRRYSMMKPGPILQYVYEQLNQGNWTDLKMLEQLVASMAGIATDTSYNDAQLQAMGGGPLLQAQTILQLLDRRHDSKTTAKRLMKSLLDTSLAGKFLVSMAQQRQACVFKDGDVPLKAIGNAYDEIHRIMIQYLDLLRSNLSADEFQSTVPDIVRLLLDFEIKPEIAFWICRPLLAKRMAESDRDLAERKAETLSGGKDAEGDVAMSDQMNDGSEEDGEAVESEAVAEAAVTPSEAEINGANLTIDEKRTGVLSPSAHQWHPVLLDIMESVQEGLPNDILELVGVGFYVTFWQLSLYDITIPGKSYEDELSRQHKRIAAIATDRSDVSITGTRKKEAEKKLLSGLIDRLLLENKQHLRAFSESKARLLREKDQWFIGRFHQPEELNIALMEYCILPRILSSPIDAYFSFKFVKFMHGVGTVNFRTIGIYDRLFTPNRLTALIFNCTSKESDNLGRFLNEVLKDFARWHKDKFVYEKEAFGAKKTLTGFALKIDSGKPTLLLDFENFRRILFKWHSNLFLALTKCLSSTEYMHIRNAISILRAVSNTYPAVNFHGTALQKAVDKLRNSDKEDLKVASQALLGALHRREKSWMIVQAFRQGQEKIAEQDPQASSIKVEESNDTKLAMKANPTASVEAEPSGTTITKISTETNTDAIDGKIQKGKQLAPIEEGNPPLRPPATTEPSIQSKTSGDPGLPDRRVAKAPPPHTNKEPGLPRRITTPPRNQPVPHLPSRPDSSETRNGHRDSTRIPPRPSMNELHRHVPEGRPYSRNPPPGERSHESASEQSHRYLRGHERSDNSAHFDRDGRNSGRDYEKKYGPDDRPRQPDRDGLRSSDRDHRLSTDFSSRKPAEILSVEGKRESQSTPFGNATHSQPESGAINPQRAALINRNPDTQAGMSIRGQAQESKARTLKDPSPNREDERRPPLRERDERAQPEQQGHSLSRANQLLSTSGPTQRSNHGFTREPRANHHQAAVDLQHGRLEQENSSRPLTRSDRASESEVPAGPRNRPPVPGIRGRAGAQINTIVPHVAYGDRPAPIGPLNSGRHTRNSSYYEQTPATKPGTPVDSAGVHPDRLNRIEPADPGPPQRSLQQQSQASPPVGPRGHAPANAPSGPSPAIRVPPTGPQVSEQLVSGRGGRNQLNTVNSTLVQAGRGTSLRGRGVRQASGTFGPYMPHTVAQGLRSEAFPPQHDLFGASNPNGVPVQPRPTSRPENARDPSRHAQESRDDNDQRNARSSNRHEDLRSERQSARNDRDERAGKDEQIRPADIRHDSHRDEPPPDDRRGYQMGQRDDLPPRKHGRTDKSGPYGTPVGRGGSRMTGDTKRPRRTP